MNEPDIFVKRRISPKSKVLLVVFIFFLFFVKMDLFQIVEFLYT